MQLLGPSAVTQPNDSTPPASTNPPAQGTGSIDQLTSESTFLQLLIAQIQNQDPLNPTDSIQFVSQLVQYSQLEQLLGINQTLDSILAKTTGPTPSSPSSSLQFLSGPQGVKKLSKGE